MPGVCPGGGGCWSFDLTDTLRLLPAYSKIARTNMKVVKARLLALVQLRTREQAFNWAMNTELLKFKSLRWPKPPLLSKRALLYCMFEHFLVLLSIFTKIKLLIVNRHSPMVFSVVVLLLQYYFCLRNIFWCISPKNSLGWEFVYFAACFVGI